MTLEADKETVRRWITGIWDEGSPEVFAGRIIEDLEIYDSLGLLTQLGAVDFPETITGQTLYQSPTYRQTHGIARNATRKSVQLEPRSPD